ncbi:hypothetical protein LXL04_002315 [Taraxacum kok-saghyz]
MASLDTDVTMVPAAEGSGGAGPSSSTASTSSSIKKAKRFEIKKWNAVSLWAWGTLIQISSWITARYVGIISWISASNVKLTKLVLPVRSAQLLGVSVIMPSTFTVLADGSKPAKSAHWITASGSSRSTVTRTFFHFFHEYTTLFLF